MRIKHERFSSRCDRKTSIVLWSGCRVRPFVPMSRIWHSHVLHLHDTVRTRLFSIYHIQGICMRSTRSCEILRHFCTYRNVVSKHFFEFSKLARSRIRLDASLQVFPEESYLRILFLQNHCSSDRSDSDKWISFVFDRMDWWLRIWSKVSPR